LICAWAIFGTIDSATVISVWIAEANAFAEVRNGHRFSSAASCAGSWLTRHEGKTFRVTAR
jgi:hypothetical protein